MGRKQGWRDLAACLDTDVHVLPERSGGRTPETHRQQAQQALELCRTCPVLEECSEWASQFRWAEVVVAGRQWASSGASRRLVAEVDCPSCEAGWFCRRHPERLQQRLPRVS